MASRGLFLGLGRVAQRKSLRDDDLDFPLLNQFRDFSQLVGIWCHAQRRPADSMLLQFRWIRASDDRDNKSALLHHAVGALQGILADAIEHNIDILGDVFEFLFGVINRHIGAEMLE